MIIDPKEIKTGLFHSYMLASVAPRPIAFASTVDKQGNKNLSPFSFFNAFGSNPPILVFSPARRVRDNTIKHTLENIYETREVVINVVNYSMVQQQSLASNEYPKGVDEFVKAGFTPVSSLKVKPFRVKESPVQMECKVLEIKETGTSGGAGNLIVCEILLMHVADDILDSENKIDANKIDLVARMGGDLYCRASGDAIFRVPKPSAIPAVGIDQLPASIRLSKILTGNDLGMLGNVSLLPATDAIRDYRQKESIQKIENDYKDDPEKFREQVHLLAKQLLENNLVEEAMLALYCAV